MLTTLTKGVVHGLVMVLVSIAFLISSVRRTFWLLASLPYRAMKIRKVKVFVISFALTLLTIYQPFISLPSSSFIGYSERMELHLDRLTARSGLTYSVPYKTVPTSKQPVENYGSAFSFFSKNEFTPVLPPVGDSETIKGYFIARNANFGAKSVTVEVQSEKMAAMFPYEPAPQDTSSFTVWTKPLMTINQHGQLPYPKHILLVLAVFAMYTYLSSSVFSWVLRRSFKT